MSSSDPDQVRVKGQIGSFLGSGLKVRLKPEEICLQTKPMKLELHFPLPDSTGLNIYQTLPVFRLIPALEVTSS